MSLAISFFDPTVEDEDAAFRGMAEMPGDLFGWESWRGVWGSKELVKRGSKFLVHLKKSDLYVRPIDIHSFRIELESILSDSTDIARALKIAEEDLQFHLHNALAACAHAEQKGLGVCIS
ncbi:hypothetical protein GCM10025770_12540 [Viridibacterium curvum]|uniref:Uncharacterized protein n=1 Tax=Viridibacterium curvum TaxID=1101404 RepID=A0ABP9QHY2_9RHOO